MISSECYDVARGKKKLREKEDDDSCLYVSLFYREFTDMKRTRDVS